MKKVFAILAIAGFMAACNNSGDKKTETPADSSGKMENPTMPDTTQKMAPDTTHKMGDTTATKM